MNIIKLITIPICFIAWAILTIAWAIDRAEGETLKEYIAKQIL
jgi:hypothetical protein